MKHIVPLSLLAAGALWVGATQIDPAGTFSDQTTATQCTEKTPADATVCSAAIASALHSSEIGGPASKQVVGSTETEQRLGSEFQELASGVLDDTELPPEIANNRSPDLASEFSADIDLEFFAAQSEFIGEFIDPDSDDAEVVVSTERVESIGEYVDPSE